MAPIPIPKYATLLPCAIHQEHQPLATYCEQHHIIPQEWQSVWSPPNFTHQPGDPNWPFAGLSPDRPGLYLWDGRTDPICRTGHGNTHFYLVKLMHWASERPNIAFKDQMTYARTQLRHTFAHLEVHAVAEALEAMVRFDAAGGNLATLWAAHAWGQI